MIVGILLPCTAFVVVHLSRREPPLKLVLSDAVIISDEPLPHHQLRNLDGSLLSGEPLRHGKVLLMFFTTDCKPCRQELALLSQLQPQLATKLDVYGVGIQSGPRTRSFITEQGFNIRIVLDGNGELMNALGVKYFPTKFLLQDGVIKKTWFGNSPNEADLLKELDL